ncbi:glycosyltransferase [Caballeronia sordidicola]|uniref:glycosyltransferase n=1 Tax=Caballeronia sordidicola TaxID=196367 RepID=UPI00068F7F69|nr:glycosyltransferase [Caballeronia sordidicola]
MEFTGERFVPDQHGGIELEHMHRYECAADLVSAKDVLDIASGEGYGSAILARVARSVVGVDISDEAIAHARGSYRNINLEFRAGSAADIPLPDASVDVVVSFETIEHHDQHEKMFAEIKRVLRPGGLLVMSSPDRRTYSEIPNFNNPFHVKELSRQEFQALLNASFAHVAMYGQRVIYGSALLAEGSGPLVSYVQDDEGIQRAPGLIDPMYLIALASDAALPLLASGVFEGRFEDNEQMVGLQRSLKAREFEISEFHEGRTSLEAAVATLRDAEEAARKQAALNASSLAEKDVELQRNSGMLASLRKQTSLHRAELIKLQREKKESDATIKHLSARVAELSAAVHAYRTSWSWRLSEPVRAASVLARRIRNIALVPARMVRSIGRPDYIAGKDVQQVEGGFISTGDDPQFQVVTGWNGMKAGWARMEIEIVSDEADLRPIVYAVAGDRGEQVFSFPIASYREGREQRLIVLPAGVRSLRFDPTDRRGVRFSIKCLSVRNVSKLALIREGYAALDPEQRATLFRAVVRGDLRTVKTLVRGGIATKYDNGEYRAWVERYDTLSQDDIARIHAKGSELPLKPLISVLMPVFNPRPKYLSKALDTVLTQTYENWELCIADDASTNPEVRAVLDEYRQRDSRIKVAFRPKNGHISAASNTALDLVTGEFVALMDHDDALPVHALYMVAEEINRHPDVDLIYTDEDKVDENDRRHDAHFKTDWNQELFYSQNFIAHMGVYRSSIARKIGGFRVGFEGSQDYDFALRFLLHSHPSRIRHIPHVLYHWRIFPGVASFSTNNPDASVESARRALVEYFSQAEPTSEVVGIEQFPSWWRIKRQPPVVLPRVSLIVPTRDRLGVLKVAIDGLLHSTKYDNMEVIIVDNESVEPETLDYFEMVSHDPRVKILRVEGAFNFSALNNRAAEIATGSVLGFINNDIEVIHDDWLLELVIQASRSNVGAVGAKLYYANDTVQHAGVILGLYGVAAHGHRHFPRHSNGYFGRPMLVQNISAVTAACMLVPKNVFENVGGYDEENLTVGYNDVDLCLKIREAGYDIVFTPFAELYHLESVSRGENVSAAQIERDARERGYMLSRWGDVIACDPFYSPNLTVASENFALAFPPRAPKSWLNP